MGLQGSAVAEVLEVTVLLPEVLDHRVDCLDADLQQLGDPACRHYCSSEICIRAVDQYDDGSPNIVGQLPPQCLGRYWLHGFRGFHDLAWPGLLAAELLHPRKGR